MAKNGKKMAKNAQISRKKSHRTYFSAIFTHFRPKTGYKPKKVFFFRFPGSPLKCRLCDYSSVNKGYYTNHVNRTHFKNKKIFSCEICDYKTDRNVLLIKHMKIHDIDNDGKFICEICPSRFITSRQKYMHMRFVHKKTPGFSCEECEFITDTFSILKEHSKRHLPEFNKKFRYSCSKCNGKFKSLLGLKNHERLKHGMKKNIKI